MLGAMFYRVVSGFALVFLTACAPLSLYHKTGAPVADMQARLLDCQVEALDKAPVASQLRRGAPRYIPPRRYCDRPGHCYHRGGYYIPGEVYSVDVNARLRRQLEAQCMARSGFRRVEVPYCPAGTTGHATSSARVLPPLTETSCAIRQPGGGWRIIEPN